MDNKSTSNLGKTKYMSNFSRNLRVFLAENNIKVKDFAVEIGVTPDTVGNWIHERVKINRLHAMKVDSYTKGYVSMEDAGY